MSGKQCAGVGPYETRTADLLLFSYRDKEMGKLRLYYHYQNEITFVTGTAIGYYSVTCPKF